MFASEPPKSENKKALQLHLDTSTFRKQNNAPYNILAKKTSHMILVN